MNARIFAALLCLTLVAVAGCGGSSASAPKHKIRQASERVHPRSTSVGALVSTPVPTATAMPSESITPTATLGPSPTATAQVRRVTPTPQPAPSPAQVLAASLAPINVAPGGRLTASVSTSGAVQRAEMYLGSGAPTAAPPLTFPLTQSSVGTWVGGGQAPSAPGQYHFSVGLFTPSGRRIVVDNDGWNILVTGPPTSPPAGQAQPLPDDIPLMSPFSYGNPVPAVFSALGGSVSGSEVVSTARPDVDPTSVAQFYEIRLPRAGWNVDQSSFPAAGATSFSISGTKPGSGGTRVVIVQYGGSAIQIYYGTAG